MKIYFLCISILLGSLFSNAQDKRALIIGIDKNQQTERAPFPELQGCINDARAMKILINAKYDFLNNNIKELYDELATRENILKSMDELLDSCRKGDVAFIFY